MRSPRKASKGTRRRCTAWPAVHRAADLLSRKQDCLLLPPAPTCSGAGGGGAPLVRGVQAHCGHTGAAAGGAAPRRRPHSRGLSRLQQLHSQSQAPASQLQVVPREGDELSNPIAVLLGPGQAIKFHLSEGRKRLEQLQVGRAAPAEQEKHTWRVALARSGAPVRSGQVRGPGRRPHGAGLGGVGAAAAAAGVAEAAVAMRRFRPAPLQDMMGLQR